jgi:hypothetical protein
MDKNSLHPLILEFEQEFIFLKMYKERPILDTMQKQNRN